MNFALEHVKDGIIISGVNIKDIDYRREVCALVFWIAPEYQRQGYDYEGLMVVCKYIIGELRMQKITPSCFEFNQARLELYQKTEFVQEGILRRDIFREENFYNSIVMGLLKEEFDFHVRSRGKDE